MKNKSIILVLIIIFVMASVGIVTYKYASKSSVDEEGIPYIYIEGNNQKVKAVRHDEYEQLFNKLFLDNNEGKYYSVNEFYDMFETINDSAIEYEADDVVYFNMYSSNNSEFSIEAKMDLKCTYDSTVTSITGATKDTIFMDKEKGNLINVGFTKSFTDINSNKDIIKVFKINFKEYGTHYYCVIANKTDIPEETKNEMDKIHSRLVMINDKIYYDTGKTTMGMIIEDSDGKINSNISEDQTPTQNNQSNFKGEYEYQIQNENFVIINIDNKMCVFALK